ncbi:cyclic nucleotide-binding domain-containing protein [Candidatus Peregrinibacteria bacterium]|nr:cyclic nucleotide-binding domain-containing protein [Candidatus Peregrinibacteria bacterium]
MIRADSDAPAPAPIHGESGPPSLAEEISIGIRGDVYSDMQHSDVESARDLLQKIKAAKPGQKINTLAEGLTPKEMETLEGYTREIYQHMESAGSALARLNASLIKHFDEDDAQELKELAKHTMGLYLNTHQYHNAVHALSMTRESLHLAEIAGITDPEILRVLVIQGLYHDAGNGIHPTPATKDADEAQAVTIFMRDVREARRRVKTGEAVGSLSALIKLRGVKINGESVPQHEVVAACIGATVFRDRFAPATSLAFQEYVGTILEQVHGTDPDFLPFRDVKRFTQLMESGPAWIARDADIAGSTYTPGVLVNNLTNRGEDVLRNMAADIGPVGYHKGFIGFLGATFHKGAVTEAVEIARAGSPLYLPEGQGNAAALIEYGKQQLVSESQRFEKLMTDHGPMLTAMFVLIGEAVAKGENFLQLPLKDVQGRLENLAQDPKRIDRAKTILKKEEITVLDIDLSRYPLLKDPRYQEQTIPEMTPGLINRIFAPNASLGSEQEGIAERLREIERACDGEQQPVLMSALELADMTPESFKREPFLNGQSIIKKDTTPGRVFIIMSGTVSITLSDGRIFSAGPGSLLGEISALTGKEATADVIATSDVDTVSLPAELVRNEYGTEELRIHMVNIMERRQQQNRTK